MRLSDHIIVNDTLQIPVWELQESFVRASGPGGQNVNKVSTAVKLRWNVSASSIPAAIKARFQKRYRARLTQTGDLILEARTHRSQKLNREAARQRLKEMLETVATPPRIRRATRPTQGSVRRRLKTKKERSQIKSLRGKIGPED